MRAECRRGWRGEAGFTLLELLAVVTITAILSGIAVPSLMRGRVAANETATIGSLRSVHTAQLSYSLSCGYGFYASNFPALGPGPSGLDGFLSLDLTGSVTPIKAGYTYNLAPGLGGVAGPADCLGLPNTVATYYVSVVPVTVNQTGTRGFAVNQGGAIWQDFTGIAPVEPFTVGPTVLPVD